MPVVTNPTYIPPPDGGTSTFSVLAVADTAGRLSLSQASALGRIIRQLDNDSLWSLIPGGVSSNEDDWTSAGSSSVTNSAVNAAIQENATGTLAALSTGSMEVTGIALDSVSDVALEAGSLSLNSTGKQVVHDGTTQGDDLPFALDSTTFRQFITRIETSDYQETGTEMIISQIPLSRIHVPARFLTDTKKTCLQGTLWIKFSEGIKPDGGIFLGLAFGSEGVVSNGMMLGLHVPGVTPSGAEQSKYDFSFEVMSSVDTNNTETVLISPYANQNGSCIASHITPGGIVTALAWKTIDEDFIVGYVETALGVANGLTVSAVVVNTSAACTATAIISGSLSFFEL